MKAWLGLIATLVVSSSAFAYLTIGESAELPAANTYQLGFEPQVLTDNGEGANISAYFDTPVTDASSARLWLGAGVIDFTAGATYKWVPFPDVENQPAIGFRIGGFFARKGGDDFLTVQGAPIFSKKVKTDAGLFTPYAAVAVDFNNTKSNNYTGTQMILGTEYHNADIPKMFFGAEVGFDLNQSYSYISGNVTFPFDSKKGLFE